MLLGYGFSRTALAHSIQVSREVAVRLSPGRTAISDASKPTCLRRQAPFDHEPHNVGSFGRRVVEYRHDRLVHRQQG
jgi:hypothetical protein